MISFTKRYVITISLIISSLIFCLINSYFLENQNFENSNYILSSSIQNIFNLVEQNKLSNIQSEKFEIQHENQPSVENEKSISQEENKDESIQEKNNSHELWQIEIPVINLKALIAEGTTMEIMDEYVGHFEETVKESGNIGLAAHNRGYKVNYFQDLKKLKQGDEIIYKYGEFEKKYVVETLKIINDEDWSMLENTEDNRITLITCVENEPQYRRLIQGIEKDANN